MANFQNLDGTVESSFKINGPAGPQIKENAGAFQLRDSADSANADISAKDGFLNSATFDTSIVFKESTNNLTVNADDQTGGARTATFPDLASSDQVTLNNQAQTLQNKTLTTPTIANAGSIIDTNANQYIIFNSVGSAVNEVTLSNNSTGNAPSITASGGDPNVGLSLIAKGSGGSINIGNTDNASPGRVTLLDNDNSAFVQLESPGTVATSYKLQFPTAIGTSNQVLQISSISGGDTAVLGFVNQGNTAGAQQTYRQTRNGSAGNGTITSTFNVPANTIVQQVVIQTITNLNAGATVTVGITGQASALMGTTDSDLTTQGIYSKFVDFDVGNSQTNFTFTVGGTPSSGEFAVTIIFTENPVT
jgi:hypothetical protein